jgi:hypothetical protein
VSEIFENTIPCAYEVAGRRLAFSVYSITEDGSNRLTPRKRVYRSGSLQNSTGAEADAWTLEIRFYNGQREPGVPTNPYPQDVGKLRTLCKIQETGTLHLPTRGPVRVRPAHWRRTETAERRDYASVEVTFDEDSEEPFDEAALTVPNARSAAKTIAKQTTEALMAEGIYSDDVASLEQLAGELEALALAPSDFVDDLEQKSQELVDTVARIEAAFATPLIPFGAPGPRALLRAPSAAHVGLLLRALVEMAAAAASAVPGRRAPVPRYYKVDVSIADVAVDLDQDMNDLMGLNSSLPNLLRIVAGTPILVRPSS